VTSFDYINIVVVVAYVIIIVTYMTTHTFTIEMTHKTNLIIVIKVVDLNTSHIYSCNHMVGIDKISSSDLIEL
jgi:hypothetical protein